MPSSPSASSGHPSDFQPTRWSLVLAAAGDDESARRALASLCATYWYPLYAYARRRGSDATTAEDLVQGFFALLLERRDLSRADPDRGRLRAYLLTAFQHHCLNIRRAGRAARRGGGRAVLSLDLDGADGRFVAEPIDERTPEDVFQRHWALDVLRAASERLRDDYRARGRETLFDALSPGLAGGDIAHTETAESLAMSRGALRVALHRLRKAFGEALREEIAQTLENPDELEDELAELRAALGR